MIVVFLIRNFNKKEEDMIKLIIVDGIIKDGNKIILDSENTRYILNINNVDILDIILLIHPTMSFTMKEDNLTYASFEFYSGEILNNIPIQLRFNIN